MKIYNYDKTTKEYLFESEASLDPQATKNQGKEVYLIPDCATVKKPPSVRKNEICIFLNGWQIKSDFRGQYIVNSDMMPEIVEEIGNIKEGYIVITDEQAQKIKEDNLFYIISNNTLIENPNYEHDKQERERQRKDQLTLTPADVERALYKAKGMDFDDLKALIVQALPTIDIKELSIEFRAKDFYRGAMANGIRLFDVVGQLLNISSEQLDRFFETKDWHYLISGENNELQS